MITIPAGYLLVPSYVFYPLITLACIEITGYIYMFFLKEWILEKWHSERIPHGTYLEVIGYDFGQRTWNLPKLRLDDIVKNLSEGYKNNFDNKLLKIKNDLTAVYGDKKAKELLTEYLKEHISEIYPIIPIDDNKKVDDNGKET